MRIQVALLRKMGLVLLGPILALVLLGFFVITSDDGGPSSRTALMLIGLGLLLGLLGLFFVTRSIAQATQILSDDAHDFANRELPRLRDALVTGQALGAGNRESELDQLEGGEFSDVASGLMDIRRSANDFGGHVGNLRSGIADTFVNLARRNQSLLDRQLEAIDVLEAQERDSDRLALLYRVDHLATRMRRNAESLLVLAGATMPQRQSPAVELREVLRVAIGEVEDYRRIVPISLDPLDIAGHLAQDLAHLIAELMENAAQHSAPGTAVDVHGAHESDGSYTIRVIDRGTGIDPARRNELNSMLSSPQSGNLQISDSIGIQVGARLAQRMGVGVFLAAGEDGGTSASVTVPAQVVADWAREGKENGVAFVGLEGAETGSLMPGDVAQEPAVIDPFEPYADSTPLDAVAPLAPEPLSVVEAPAPAPADIFEPAAPTMVPPLPDTQPAATSLGQPELGSFDGLGASEPESFEQPLAPVPPVDPFSLAEPATPVEPLASVSPIVPLPPVTPIEPLAPVAPVEVVAPASPVQPFEPFEATPLQVPEPPTTFETNDIPDVAPVAPQPIPEAVGPVASELGAGGLKKRQRGVNVEDDFESSVTTAPSRRSPDQVRSMLSRYKNGLERGRTNEGEQTS